MRRGRVLITPELMADLLSFPPGTRVLPTVQSSVPTGASNLYIEIFVEHDDLKESDRAEDAQPSYTRDKDGQVTFVDWGQK